MCQVDYTVLSSNNSQLELSVAGLLREALTLSTPSTVRMLTGENEVFEYVSPTISIFIPEKKMRMEVTCDSKIAIPLIQILKGKFIGGSVILSTPPYEEVVGLFIDETEMSRFLGILV